MLLPSLALAKPKLGKRNEFHDLPDADFIYILVHLDEPIGFT
jgi:hypothetical protein